MENNQTKNKLIIAGAGPGDPDLISVKALNTIKNADVILYDALINPLLLNNTKEDCIKIFVGKRANKHLVSQEEINNLCVEYARIYRTVLRLKGGDPFIFGRGFEELDYARNMGIEVEIIPGISSATSLTGLSGIPLTCRGINYGFSVVTAVDKNGNITEELVNSAKSELTTVILMGFGKLRQISALYENLGKGDLPAIIISNGSLNSQKKHFGLIKNLPDEITNRNFQTPAIIAVGEVVKLYKSSNNILNEYTLSNISEAG